jgi:transposase InsO family protein
VPRRSRYHYKNLFKFRDEANEQKSWPLLTVACTILQKHMSELPELLKFATLEWVDWFNNRRLLEPIGNIPPAEAEERYYAMLNEPAMAA